jgi:hypothetical protein
MVKEAELARYDKLPSNARRRSIKAVRCQDLPPGATSHFIRRHRPSARMPAEKAQRLSDSVEKRRMITASFRSRTHEDDTETQAKMGALNHRADKMEEMHSVLEPQIEVIDAGTLLNASSDSKESAPDQSLIDPPPAQSLQPEDALEENPDQELTPSPQLCAVNLNERKRSIEQLQQTHSQQACAILTRTQAVLKTLIACQWAKVRLGRADVVEAAFFEMVANHQDKHNTKSFWISLGDFDNDFEVTCFHGYYQSICKHRGVTFSPDISLETGVANLADQRMKDVTLSFSLHVRDILRSHMFLLKPKAARKCYSDVESSARAIDFDDRSYFTRSLTDQIKMDEGILKRSLVRFSEYVASPIVAGCAFAMPWYLSTNIDQPIDHRRCFQCRLTLRDRTISLHVVYFRAPLAYDKWILQPCKDSSMTMSSIQCLNGTRLPVACRYLTGTASRRLSCCNKTILGQPKAVFDSPISCLACSMQDK